MQNMDLLIASLEFIEVHLRESFKTADIADACYCSKSTLEKLFQYVYATSVHEYVVRRKMMIAARLLTAQPETTILSVAMECGYSSHEAFTRAFKNVWNCNPSEFRQTRFMELFPRLREPIQEGDEYMKQRKNVDISQLYDLFQKRRECYFVCCDIKSLIPINEISRKAGDLAIIEAMRRMDAAAGEEDVVFRIGGDEFCILTNSSDPAYAQQIADAIAAHNGECFNYCGKEGPAQSVGGCLIASGKEGPARSVGGEIPLTLYTTLARFEGETLKYSELFTGMHKALEAAK